jgi:hypothetical protein
MQKLNVKISNEAYKQVCRDFDTESRAMEYYYSKIEIINHKTPYERKNSKISKKC